MRDEKASLWGYGHMIEEPSVLSRNFFSSLPFSFFHLSLDIPFFVSLND
jgi:hypothetical protein